MKPLTTGQKAQIALLCIWLTAGFLIWIARASAPNASSVIGWLRSQPPSAAQELPLRLSRLAFPDQERVLTSPEFTATFRTFTSQDLRAFATAAVPSGLCALLAEARKAPDATRDHYFQSALDDIQAERLANDPRMDRSLFKTLVHRGIAMYQDEASAEDQLVMMPLIQHFLGQLQWL